MQTRVLMLAAAVGLLALGCGKKKDDAPTTGSGAASGSAAPGGGVASGSGAASGSAATPAESEVLPPAEKIDEAAVKKVIDAWLAAQNSGDFAAYSALYADKMEGVKRVGPRTWRFDKKGWLADRARMFKHPMTVTATDVQIRGTAKAPSVELVQGFKQGKFADQGPKAIALIKGQGGFLIAREEMLVSSVAGVAAPGAAPLYLVVEVDGRQHVVISDDTSSVEGKGRIAGPFAGMHQFAMQDAAPSPSLQPWQNRALAVYDATGARCDATVGAIRLLGGGSPHFGVMQEWDNQEGMGDGHVWSRGERARAIFEMGTQYVVGELAITGPCKPLFAVDPAAKPTVMASATPDAALAEAARAAFRKLPAYGDLQQSWKDDYQGTGPWTASPNVAQFGDYLVVSASEGSGCGDFLGQLVAIYQVKNGQPALVSSPSDYTRVDAILDSDGDGKLELIGAVEDFRTVTAYLTLDASGNPSVAREVSFPFNDCGC